jgi:hypothetical protein
VDQSHCKLPSQPFLPAVVKMRGFLDPLSITPISAVHQILMSRHGEGRNIGVRLPTGKDDLRCSVSGENENGLPHFYRAPTSRFSRPMLVEPRQVGCHRLTVQPPMTDRLASILLHIPDDCRHGLALSHSSGKPSS